MFRYVHSKQRFRSRLRRHCVPRQVRPIYEGRSFLTRTTTSNPPSNIMKKLVFSSVILVIAALAYFWGYPAYIESCKNHERQTAVYLHQRFEHQNLLLEKIGLLADAIKKFEDQSGLRTEDLNMFGESATPAVLRHRVKDIFGEKWSYIEQDTMLSLQTVIKYQYLLNELGTIADKNELRFQLSSPSRDKAAQLHGRAWEKVESIRSEFRQRAQIIDLMVWADVPEWRRKNMREIGTLKLN
jgi:hypothetical protein